MLVEGLHRLEVAKALGEETIVAFLVDALRPAKLSQHQRAEALERLAKGETLVDVARTYGVDPTTIGRLKSPFDGVSEAA